MPAFIEIQFPIARLSSESYKERKANNSQTLTRLGKWWGRKPLILVRASVLGMLMPASDDPIRDREIFLKILTMDDTGTLQRWRDDKKFTQKELRELATPEQAAKWDALVQAIDAAVADKDAYDQARIAEIRYREELQLYHFRQLSYDDRLTRCWRPEQIDGPYEAAWREINAHLDTSAHSLPELVEELGQKRFGHTPRVGDAFCGGGSIPFEAARIGCQAFGSDLNPVAGLLTWASLNLLGGGAEVQKEVIATQEKALQAADRQVTEWAIEHNEEGERADAYLYCVEVKPEGCDYFIPLAPSWLVGERSKVVCDWQRVPGSDRLQPEIREVDTAEVKAYKGNKNATVVSSRVIDPFQPERSWSLESLRGPEGLRRWENDDLVPRPGDVFQERLYCIRWTKTVTDSDGKTKIVRRYAAPTEADLQREETVLRLLRERFPQWQEQGFVPSRAIPLDGDKTEEPIRTRGWTYWHHLFTPRQLLTHGLLAQCAEKCAASKEAKVGCLLGLGRIADWNSRLCAWMFHATNEKGNQVFYNQALNCHYSYAGRGFLKLEDTFAIITTLSETNAEGKVLCSDARDLTETCDLWITDPPYADAVNYHELGDFFLAWQEKAITRLFPEWIPDARAELAVRGADEDFRRSMVEIYRNLADHMPDNGLQMVMFTHQDPAVWADLGMILWAAGLHATAAWTISTETAAVGIKKGNYVQGTVCLVLRKRSGEEPGFLDEVYPLVEDEVRRQIDSMQALDEGGEPNFNDADYQLAAYAAALKVLTGYATLDGRDVSHEVFAVRDAAKPSAFQEVIERAITIACDVLIPRGLENLWRELSQVERYYLRALDIESRGERRQGMYEELARGFGIHDIRPLLQSSKANETQMKNPGDFSRRNLVAPGSEGVAADDFAQAPLRHLLFAIRETQAADNPDPGRQYLRDTFGPGYWQQRERFLTLLDWLATTTAATGMTNWTKFQQALKLLRGRLRTDEA